MSDSKKYNIYTFLSFFSKSMIEMFISVILYKEGIKINNILLYMLFNNIITIFCIFIISIIKNKIKYNMLLFIDLIFFVMFSIYLFNTKNNIISLFILALFSSLHNSIFWILRHIYIINIYKINELSKGVGNLLIYVEIAFLSSGIIGAYILDNYSYIILTIIASIILFISNLTISKIKIQSTSKSNYVKIIKHIPKRNIIFFILEQFKVIGYILFPLYLTIILKTSYKFIGNFGIFISGASIISIFWFSRLINKKKKSYLFPITFIFSIIWILKINIKTKLIIFIIGFSEGIISKLYQTGITRFTYALGKKYDYFSYITLLEIFFSLIRSIILIIFILFIKDLKLILYICSITIFLTGFVKFNDLND